MAFREQGAALITALFIMALIAAASIAMLNQQEVFLQEVEGVINYQRVQGIGDLVQAWARDNLLNDLSNTALPIDQFPKQYPHTTFAGGDFSGEIIDAQSLFNLNTLANQAQQTSFLALLQTVLPSLENPQTVVNNIVNWISPEPNAMLDAAYQHLPYKVIHQPMIVLSQLRQVAGITPEIYEALRPYVTVLPANNTLINVNTASAPVLLTLKAGLTLDVVNSIIAARPFQTITAFMTTPVVSNNQLTTQVTVQSNYFFEHALVKVGDQTLLLNSLLFRTVSQGNAIVTVLYQSQGET